MADRAELPSRPQPGPQLSRYLVAAAVGLAVLHAGLWLLWGKGSIVVVLPWYVPMMHSFVALAALSVAFLAFGRYRVLGEPAPYWLGVGFSTFAIFMVFYMLSWPGLLPGEGGLISSSLNATSWYWHLAFSALAFFQLVALFAHWPPPEESSGRSWILVTLLGWLASVAVGLLVLAVEGRLPPLAVEGAFTPLNIGWNGLLLIAYSAAAALSARRYLRAGDSLFAYVALTETLLAYSVLTSIVGERFYDEWWYWQRILWVVGFSVLLFGLLSEYVSLYRRELLRTRELAELRGEAIAERNRLSVLIDTTPVGIIFRSAPDGRVVLRNKAAEAIMGRPLVPDLGLAEEISYYGLAKPNGEPMAVEELPSACALRGETCLGTELLIRQPSGREVSVLANAAPLWDGRGRVIGSIVALQDVTAIREGERLRAEFLSAAAHELKTPVTTIKGFAQILHREQHAQQERQVARAIEVIDAQCNRLNRRVQELLEVVQLGATPAELGYTRFDLGELADEVCGRFEIANSSHDLVLERSGPVEIEADRERIEEVIASLVENAIRYSPAGGEVVVRVWRERDEAMVAVRDHGVGIPRERQPHVFEPFYEAVPTGTPGYRGTVALSLHLSKLTVERHKGRIWFESEVGRGSTFYFSLPLTRRGHGTPEKAA